MALLLATCAWGQTKYEKEYRLAPEKVPFQAQAFLDSLAFPGKVKWYFEENLQTNSVEAKVQHQQKKYSIEFDPAGTLQDIEIEWDWKELPADIRKAINEQLCAAYDSFKIRQIQIQYTGDKASLLAVAKNMLPPGKYKTQYELLVKGKKGNVTKLYEITFSQNGSLLETSEIIFRNTDTLEY